VSLDALLLYIDHSKLCSIRLYSRDFALAPAEIPQQDDNVPAEDEATFAHAETAKKSS
jgi:hypothetical protein